LCGERYKKFREAAPRTRADRTTERETAEAPRTIKKRAEPLHQRLFAPTPDPFSLAAALNAQERMERTRAEPLKLHELLKNKSGWNEQERSR
jgi:hypothetical protein